MQGWGLLTTVKAGREAERVRKPWVLSRGFSSYGLAQKSILFWILEHLF